MSLNSAGWQIFLTFWLGTKCNYFEKLTIRTVKQGSSLVVAWPATMQICPVGPDPVHVPDGMSRLTVSGRKGHFFEKSDIFYTKTGVEIGRRVTRNHANLSGRPGPSSRTRCVAIDSFGEKRSFFWHSDLGQNVIILRNWQFVRSNRGRVWSSRDPQPWKSVIGRPGPSSRTRWTFASDSFGEKRSFFWDSYLGQNVIILRNWQFVRSYRSRVWSIASPATMKIFCTICSIKKNNFIFFLLGTKCNYFEKLTFFPFFAPNLGTFLTIFGEKRSLFWDSENWDNM